MLYTKQKNAINLHRRFHQSRNFWNSGKGFKRLFKITNDVINRAQKKYSTAVLNKLLTKFTNQSAPPSVGGRQLKLKHIHFGGMNPTTFIIHSNQDKKIPQNYKNI